MSNESDLDYVPSFISEKFRELVDSKAANLKLIGSEDPDVLAGLDAAHLNQIRIGTYKAIKYFYDEGISKSKVHWTVAAAATPGWGAKIFPDSPPDEVEEMLWDEIFKICRADKENCLEMWHEHNAKLQRRAKAVNEMGVKTLHFTGPGTDLKVGLSQKAIFKGGTDMGPRGAEFEPNIPTEEIFTTPDWRMTEGSVAATRPFLINGTLIENLKMTFAGGVLTDFSATNGESTFREYTDSDEGAKRLGEVALVGIDSPIYQSGLVFEEILYDENAACHIAIGSAYKFCVDGGENMNKEELEAIGCNESSVHTDMMISSEEVDVMAETHDGKNVQLIKNGEWCI